MSPPLPHPDAMPVREALRVLRHGMRRSRNVLREVVPVEGLPAPAGYLAGRILRNIDSLAGEVDHMATVVARRLLLDKVHIVPALHEFEEGTECEVIFAEGMYSALRAILRRMGDIDTFISEAVLRRSYALSVRADPGRMREQPTEAAADLMLRLLAARVLRDISPELEAHLKGDAAPVALFAALLWLMSDRNEEDAEEILISAADLAVALTDEIAAATAARDRQRISSLFSQFAAHV